MSMTPQDVSTGLPYRAAMSMDRLPGGTPESLVLAGQSAAATRLRVQLERIAPHYRCALFTGEVGSGKEMAARRLHALSPAADGPFVVCDASVLASDGKAFETARRGTLYVDRVGMLPLPMQDGLVRRLIHLDRMVRAHVSQTRLVTSSHCDLRTMAASGRFRQDLYGRIAVVELRVLPLRERIEDLEALGERLLLETGRQSRRLSPETVTCLGEYGWPGNLTELRQVLAHAAGQATGDQVEVWHLPELKGTACSHNENAAEPAVERLDDVVKRHVLEVLSRCAGNKLRAAELLGISRSTLYRMLDAG